MYSLNYATYIIIIMVTLYFIRNRWFGKYVFIESAPESLFHFLEFQCLNRFVDIDCFNWYDAILTFSVTPFYLLIIVNFVPSIISKELLYWVLRFAVRNRWNSPYPFVIWVFAVDISMIHIICTYFDGYFDGYHFMSFLNIYLLKSNSGYKN